MDKIFAIVVTYNGMRHDWLDKCLGSLSSSVLSVQIIVVDNASTDGTVEYIRENFPETIVIANSENLGFGQANNRGLEHALELGGEFFFLLNQDAWIEKDCISKLLLTAKKNPDFAIISPLHLNGSGVLLDANFHRYIGSNSCSELISDFLIGKGKDKIYPTTFVNAAAWLLPRSTFEIVGGFNPAFFHYGEDDNFCHRVLYHQLKIGIYPHAKIYHDRESRVSSVDPMLQLKREWLINLSNPLLNQDLKARLKLVRKSIVKHVLAFRKDFTRYSINELCFLRGEGEKIVELRKKSKTSEKFLFLDNMPTTRRIN